MVTLARCGSPLGKSSREHTLIRTTHVLTLLSGAFTLQVAASARKGIPKDYQKVLCSEVGKLCGKAPMHVKGKNLGISKKKTPIQSKIFIRAIINTHKHFERAEFISSGGGDNNAQPQPYFQLYFTRLGDKIPIREVFKAYPELRHLLTVASERNQDFILDIGVVCVKNPDDAFILWKCADKLEHLIPEGSITLHKLFNQEDMGTLQFDIKVRGPKGLDPKITVKVYNGFHHMQAAWLTRKFLHQMPKSTANLRKSTAAITECTQDIIEVVRAGTEWNFNTRSEYTIHGRTDSCNGTKKTSPDQILRHIKKRALIAHDLWTQPRKTPVGFDNLNEWPIKHDLELDHRLPFHAYRVGFEEWAEHWEEIDAYAKGLKGGDLSQGFHKGSTSVNKNVTIRKQQV